VAPMVVWFAHVRVGHRQLSILDKPPLLMQRGFSFVWIIYKYLKAHNSTFIAILLVHSIAT
ncbi:hypothetical protein MT378_08165, partial [Psychrobacter sp. 16-Bac2893]